MRSCQMEDGRPSPIVDAMKHLQNFASFQTDFDGHAC